jgi:hypothetical protein
MGMIMSPLFQSGDRLSCCRTRFDFNEEGKLFLARVAAPWRGGSLTGVGYWKQGTIGQLCAE